MKPTIAIAALIIAAAALAGCKWKGSAGDAVSANGFACSKAAEGGVRCEGSFPGQVSKMEASGGAPLILGVEMGGKVYAYRSDTGCLTETDHRGRITATHRGGKAKLFNETARAMEFCRKGP